jgi:hypothetical protein
MRIGEYCWRAAAPGQTGAENGAVDARPQDMELELAFIILEAVGENAAGLPKDPFLVERLDAFIAVGCRPGNGVDSRKCRLSSPAK